MLNVHDDAYHQDWVVSTASNVHVATDIRWFTDYTPFETHVNPNAAGAQTQAHGIGTVVLPTRVHREGNEYKPGKGMTLRNTLYVPSFIVNIFAANLMGDQAIRFARSRSCITDAESGEILCLIADNRLLRLWLEGQPKHSTVLNSDCGYVIGAQWPSQERARWEEFSRPSIKVPLELVGEPASYTQREKQYLKRHFGNEYKFLRSYGLSIHDEEDRAEGRTLLRALMAEDVDASSNI